METAGPPSAPRPRVLIVDDEEIVATFVARVLERMCEVVVVGTGRDAIAQLDGTHPAFDLVLCDLLLPDMTGRDVHAALTRHAPALAARTVMMTGGVLDPELMDFIEALPVPPLRKPLDVRRVRDAVTAALAEAPARSQ